MPKLSPTMRMSRRNALKGGLGFAVGVTLLPYKSMAAEEKALNFYNWDTYIGATTLADFNKATGVEVKMDLFADNDELFAKLKAGNPGYDVIVPSGNYIQRMVAAKMLMPLDHAKIPNFKNFAKEFQDAEFDPGRKYSLAYMWGTMGIGYRKSKMKDGKTPDSWGYVLDLPDYAGRISVQGDSEHAIGIALKKLGYNWNSTNATELGKAKDLLIASKKNIKTFAKDNGQDLLASQEVDLAVEYSGDIAQVKSEDDDLDFSIPKEGSNRWQDTMAIASGAPHPENAHAFLNFICDPAVNAEIVKTIHYGTPNEAARALMDDDYKNNPITFPPADVLAKCDPSLYLGEDGQKARDDIWTAVQAA
ncbi:ABC transporter substrate-binding protein [Aestuariivirga litoralis]|uniref:ABC transporter substrate-binding protein n=1 Tax=Aestuariivirga litoralis TaxID=2650924 RepID=UPI0018C7C24E|nr:spermidine/putrescine ABC transporter substrate-binding protein [Aestuariivirga litoralis]MBG1232071.1 spermidine/putrescine ABC transporter substrate-binding protein [Aestuariivirga litoralis]